MNAFWIILTGSLVAVSCGLLGCYLILRKMSMIGDAISHAVLPGIFLAYWFIGDRASLPILLGTAGLGVFSTFMIESLSKRASLQLDAAIGLTFTFLFAVGVILISANAGNVELDQDCVLYGEIAYVPLDTWVTAGGTDMGPEAVWIMGSVLLFIVGFISIGYRGLFLTTFDPAYAAAIGISTAFWHYMLMGAVSLTTVLAFESVGAILVVAFLIGPAATAYLLTNNLKIMLLLSALVGVLTAIGGYYLAYFIDGSIAGAMASVLGLLFMLALLFSPSQGVITRKFRHAVAPAIEYR